MTENWQRVLVTGGGDTDVGKLVLLLILQQMVKRQGSSDGEDDMQS